MDKGRIKNFATTARKKLMDAIKSRASLMGVTADGIAEPVDTGPDYERYEAVPGASFILSGDDVKKREDLVRRVREKGFDAVIEEVAYTWFNRLIAVRFMEVNDYLPTRTRVLSSSTPERTEPDIVREALEIDLGLSDTDRVRVIELRSHGDDRAMTELFSMLFIRQCNKLSEILPELFMRTADYTELLLNISYLTKEGVVRDLVDNIPEDDFREAVEIVGWMYQYYIKEDSDLVYDGSMKKSRIPRSLLPAATQIFTPDWVVRYMVENSLGRFWLEHHPNEELHKKWKYYVGDQPVSKKSSGLSLSPEEITFFDPCMGSGHMLVYAFEVLMDIYKNCGYSESMAAKLILEKNLYGFDIDYRAYQLTYFALMMKARFYSRKIFKETIQHNLSLSYSAYPQSFSEPYTNSVIEKTRISCDKETLRRHIADLLSINQNVYQYGSLAKVKELPLEEIKETLSVLDRESVIMDFRNIFPIIKQARILSGKYDIVCTNPPYLGNSRMNEHLDSYVKHFFAETKSDLAICFFKKATDDFCKKDGYIAFITTNSWMFLGNFEKFRKKVLAELEFETLVDFGSELFEGKVGHNLIVAWVNKKCQPSKPMKAIRLVDYCYSRRDEKEEEFFNEDNRYTASADNFAKIPGSPVAYWASERILDTFKYPKLCEKGEARSGLQTGDNDLFLKQWFEVVLSNIFFGATSKCQFLVSRKKWLPQIKGGEFRKWYGNFDYIVNWENDGEQIRACRGCRLNAMGNENLFFKSGITWSHTTSSSFGARFLPEGFLFNVEAPTYFTDKGQFYFLGHLNSKLTNFQFSILNATMHYLVGDILKLPINIIDEKCSLIDSFVQQNITISRIDWDSFETSWDFQTHPLFTHKGNTLEASFNNWQVFADAQFAQLKSNEEELNRIFIEIYGLQDELTPEVEDKDVTIRRADRARDVRSFISYAVGCMFGRYSPDTPGLCFAGGEWDDAKYQMFKPDQDNIIPINDDEYFPDDIVARFMEFVRVTYGVERLEENLAFIARSISDKSDTPRSVIRNYFVRDFYKDHIKIYKKRPIYWLFDSGKQDAFKALIYLHRYDENIVGNIRTNYLHRTQTAIERGVAACGAVIDSDAPSTEKSRATKRREKLNKQLAEITQYDQAIAHVALGRINLDLDDGVKVNYAKFQGIGTGGRGGKVDLLGKLE